MKKILFLHGFYASGQCIPAVALREAFEGRVEVITPDLPMHPKETLRFIRGLIEAEKPDLLIGNSCGAFYAQMVAIQFDNCRPDYKDRIWGLFGEQDTLAHFEPIFLHHYNRSFHFPGGHTPTAEEVRSWYVPLAEKMLEF